MNLGVDIGYSYTKDSNYNCFRSEYQLGLPMLGGNKLIYNSKEYTVGIGSGEYSPNRINTELINTCLLTILGMNNNTNFNLVLGLPIGQFTKQKNEFQTKVLNEPVKKFELNGIEKTVTINDCVTFPQGLGALYGSNIVTNAIIIDMGGYTIDIAYVRYENGKHALKKCDTIYKGTLLLYEQIVKEINNRYDLTLDPEEAEDIIHRGLYVKCEKQDTKFLIPIYNNYISPIIKTLQINDYPYQTTNVYLCGGGANLLYYILNNKFNCVLMENAQFCNAVGFGIVADMVFKNN
jgi:hypothetical protein